MKKLFITALIGFVLTGCVASPYSPKETMGGYTVESVVDENTAMVKNRVVLVASEDAERAFEPYVEDLKENLEESAIGKEMSKLVDITGVDINKVKLEDVSIETPVLRNAGQNIYAVGQLKAKIKISLISKEVSIPVAILMDGGEVIVGEPGATIDSLSLIKPDLKAEQ